MGQTEKDGHHGGYGRSTSNSGNVYGQAAQPVSANNEIARKGGKTTGARDPVSSSTVRASVPALKGRTPHGPPQIEPSCVRQVQQIDHVERVLVGFQVNSSIPLFDRK